MSEAQMLLRAAALWDGTGGDPLRPGRLLVEGGRVAALGAAAERLADPGLAPVDLPDCTLLPGLIDMHGHARLNPRLGPLEPQTRDEPVGYVLRSLDNLRLDLASGVTTVKTNGDRDFLDVGLRDAIAAGLAPGPHLFVATRGIKAPDCTAGIVATAICRGPAAVRATAEENFAGGADFIKLYTSGGLLAPIEEACRAYYSFEEIRAAVEVAEAHGSYVVAHCVGGPSATWCSEAGVRVVEHGFYLDDTQLRLFRERGTRLDLTLGVAFHPEGHGAGLPGLDRARELAYDTVRRSLQLGVSLVLGTDGMHGLLSFEAEQVVALGASPSQALLAMTREASRALGQDGQLGTLEVGKQADLIAVTGDPTVDVSALARVRLVVKGGRAVAPSSSAPA